MMKITKKIPQNAHLLARPFDAHEESLEVLDDYSS
jgi:hypothetical protein